MQALHFGTVEIRPSQRQLLVGGQAVAVGGRAYDVLCALVEQRDRVVPKNELLDRVWAGLVVEENNLQTQVSTLRKLLGAGAIATVPGRGYRFTLEADGEESTREESAAPSPASVTQVALPPAPVTMLGRDDDLAALEHLLKQHRLVTVVGAGGIGKTTLALAGAHALHPAEPDGAAWVELAPLTDPALLASNVAQALGISVAGNNPQASLVKALAPRRGLLVLDNAEHLVDAVATLVQALLDGAPGLRMLVTSQAALQLGSERLFRLGALAAPEVETTVDDALGYGAVALFVDQAQAADRRFRLTPENLPTVLDLCAHLDGVALAIKLAAARLPLFGLQGLKARMSERFRLLGHGPRSAPTRQQTLRAALDWSHSLLPPHEQTVFRRLGVFDASFPLELAAHTACDNEHDEWSVIDALGVLVDRSLVMLEPEPQPRYRLLESAREYALAKLEEAGEWRRVHEHAARVQRQQFPGLAERDPQRVARLLTEGGCLEEAVTEWERAAAQALARAGNAEAVLHLGKAIELTRTLAASAADPAALLRRELALQLRLGPLVMLTNGLGSAAAERLYDHSLALCNAVGTVSEKFISVFNLWFIAESQLRLDDAEKRIAEAMSLAEASGDERFIVQARHAGWSTAVTTGQYARALADTEDGYRRYRPVDGPFHQSTFAGHDPGLCAIGHGAIALWALGRPEEAEVQLARLRQGIGETAHPPSQIVGRYIACLAYTWAREPRRMRAMAEETLAICKRMSLQQYEGLFTVFTAWASAWIDRDPTTSATLANGLEKFASTGTKLRVSLLGAIAADACAAAGQIEPGLAFAERALHELVERKEFGWHAYALTCRGALLAQDGQRAAAAESYVEALAVARSQGGGTFELRAAHGLARLWRDSGRSAEVRPLLEPLVARFAAGLSTPDLDDARALLQGLG